MIPEYHVGRYKGVKNKRSGLEKAIYQVEQAIKRSKTGGGTFDTDTDVDLRQLINPSTPAHQHRRQSSSKPMSDPDPLTRTLSEPGSLGLTQQNPIDEVNGIALDNADNPLQLLAMASAMPAQSPTSVVTPSPAITLSQIGSHTGETEDRDLQTFFGSLMPVLDNTRDIDPVELGLVTEEEADLLFA